MSRQSLVRELAEALSSALHALSCLSDEVSPIPTCTDVDTAWDQGQKALQRFEATNAGAPIV